MHGWASQAKLVTRIQPPLFVSSFIAIVSNNPFIYLLEFFIIAGNIGLFHLRVQMAVATSPGFKIDDVRVPKIRMFLQHAQKTFSCVFVPILLLVPYLLLFPFHPSALTTVFVLNAVATSLCIGCFGMRQLWCSTLHAREEKVSRDERVRGPTCTLAIDTNTGTLAQDKVQVIGIAEKDSRSNMRPHQEHSPSSLYSFRQEI